MIKNMIQTIGILFCFACACLWSGCAPVTVSSVPEGASVYLKKNNELIGTTPVCVNMIAADKEVIVRKDGYFSKTLQLSTIGATGWTVSLEKRERVLLISKPSGAALYIAGMDEQVGRTPYLIDYSKPVRTFELRAPGYAPRSITVPDDPEGNIKVDLERQASVTLESKPKRASVFNSAGKRIGMTPLEMTALEATDYELRKEGYYSRTVTVGPQTETPYVISLQREPHIIVYSKPEGARVVYRGVTLGITPYRQLVKSEMKLELEFDRYYTSSVTLTPDAPRRVEVTLNPKPYITVESKPSGARLFRSGGIELIGETPVEILVEKDTALELQKPGFDVKSFMLSPDAGHHIEVALVQSLHSLEKTVRIDSTPTGALVYRPGGAELIGRTPLEQRVRTERSFELQLDGFRTKIVTVAPDSAHDINFALARDESARNVTISDPLLNTPSSF